jgi:hypothetical protein
MKKRQNEFFQFCDISLSTMIPHHIPALIKDALQPAPRTGAMDWPRGDASGDTWEPLEHLTNCEEAIAAYERATGRTQPRHAPRPPLAAGSAGSAPPPAGFTVDAGPPPDLGAALVCRQLLYWWPDDGWQRCTVARLCPRPASSHVVAYTRQTSALRGTAESGGLAASMSPPPSTAPGGCCCPPPRPRACGAEPVPTHAAVPPPRRGRAGPRRSPPMTLGLACVSSQLGPPNRMV